MNHLVLIGDIVASTKISLREKTQENLNDILNKLNINNPNLASRYTITLGDEFQAVFSNANTVFFECMEILSAVYPEKIRFSVGVGKIVTRINYEQALGMDGPAFHFARHGIDELKGSGYLFNILGLEYPHIGLLKESLYLISYTCKQWNQNRLRTFASMYKNEDVQKIAGNLHITDKAVYKTMAAGNLSNIQRLLNEITLIINEYMA